MAPSWIDRIVARAALPGFSAVFAVVVGMCGVSALAFALGMYLPMELNSPIVLGAAVAWFLQRSSKNAALNKARHEKGTLIASGGGLG